MRAAVAAIGKLVSTETRRCSSAYRSRAIGPGEQPDYLNAVVQLATKLQPLALLDALQQIERQQGRVRSLHWGPRTLDLDLLLYGDRQINHPRLQVPHPRLCQRNFVLYPLAEIAGQKLQLPDGTELDTLLANCPRDDLATTDLELEP